MGIFLDREKEIRSQGRSSCSPVLKKIKTLYQKSHNHAVCGIFFTHFATNLPQVGGNFNGGSMKRKNLYQILNEMKNDFVFDELVKLHYQKADNQEVSRIADNGVSSSQKLKSNGLKT